MDHQSSPDKPVSIHPDVRPKDKAQEGRKPPGSFAAQQPQCGFCELGLLPHCVMGPRRIDPSGTAPAGRQAHIIR